MASSSSMKMIDGAASRACLKRSRTRAAPTPTIISMNSEALRLKKGTPALVERPGVDHHTLRLEQRLEAGVGEGGQQRLEAQRAARVRPLARVGHLLLERALDRVPLAGHLRDVAGFHLLLEERVGNVDVARLGG